jgi:hypothetical protein
VASRGERNTEPRPSACRLGTSVAIKTTTSMVLISIRPFALRKLFLIVAALVCFSVVCFADPIFVAQRYTSPASERPSELKRVDVPSHGQESLPSVEGAARSAFPRVEADLPVLVISAHFAYT